jgi:hydrogenase maturation protein HypF
VGRLAGLSAPRAARHVTVTGVVQGVGFRPFVHRLALRHELGGWIRNRAGDVEIRVEGAEPGIRAFLDALTDEAPPLARIEAVDIAIEEAAGDAAFRILVSTDDPDRRQPVSPDVAVCAACEAELFDPADRRWRYPFITCTDCGPRFTVIDAMPYDRARTTMRVFAQCPACLAEYAEPGHRRYHSETNSCSACGPRLWYADAHDTVHGAEAALATAAECLLAGGVVAVRGLGGFHLAADATHEETVATLRRRKHREAKPFAVMVRTLDQARALGRVGTEEAGLLTSLQRPIVLLRRRGNRLAPSVCCGLDTVGVMLAATPLHHLLLEKVGRPLVMTSGNRSDEPIATDNEEALHRLANVADGFLLHDREIVSRYDDSVVRVVAGATVLLRRARGYAPLPVALPWPAPVPILAVGPHLKNTFALAHQRAVYVSQHIGDLEDLDTLEHFRATLDAYRRLFRIEPQAVARDLHPGYLSSRVAEESGLAAIVDVQHHHAHVVATAAEHGVTDPVIGIAFDGTGLGADGNVWGAEFLVADALAYRRVARLRYAPLPGGDLAARRPWRSALGYRSLEPAVTDAFRAAFDGVDATELGVAQRQIELNLNAPLASSMGRLLDAAAALLGVRSVSRFEGEAAMALETLAADRAAAPLPFPIIESGDTFVLDPLPLLVALGEGRAAGEPVQDLAAAFHESIVRATVVMACRIRDATGIGTAALGGGVFQNARLLASLRSQLDQSRFRTLVPARLPPNDGGISYGQAAIAAARLRTQP